MSDAAPRTTLHVPAGTIGDRQDDNTKVTLAEGEYTIETGNTYCDGKVSRLARNGEVFFVTNDVFDELYLSRQAQR